MNDCDGGNLSTAQCRCVLDILQVRYTETAYRELERAIQRDQRTDELMEIVNVCTR